MYDELELDLVGDRKTALFFIISDTDATFNFLVSMAYTQLFNLLCERADDKYGGRLPVHVRCLIDEAANIGQIPNLEKLMATIRSREISACLVLQAQSQLKALYTPNIFKGRIFCGDCGRSLHRQRQQCNGSYRFHCLTPTRVHKDKCAGVSISETELMETVLDILKRELAAVLGDYALLLNDNIQKQEKEAATREKINRAKLQLSQSREFLQTLYESLMNGAIDSEEYFVLKATYEEQMQAAQKELSFYENQSAVRQEQAEKCKNLEKDEHELLAGGSLTAALIERLIERITVYPNKQVDVKFTFRTEFEAFKEAAAE